VVIDWEDEGDAWPLAIAKLISATRTSIWLNADSNSYRKLTPIVIEEVDADAEQQAEMRMIGLDMMRQSSRAGISSFSIDVKTGRIVDVVRAFDAEIGADIALQEAVSGPLSGSIFELDQEHGMLSNPAVGEVIVTVPAPAMRRLLRNQAQSGGESTI
jgi:hypothetical protein